MPPQNLPDAYNRKFEWTWECHNIAARGRPKTSDNDGFARWQQENAAVAARSTKPPDIWDEAAKEIAKEQKKRTFTTAELDAMEKGTPTTPELDAIAGGHP